MGILKIFPDSIYKKGRSFKGAAFFYSGSKTKPALNFKLKTLNS